MKVFYILKVQGPFKQYYSESTQSNILKKHPEFTAMLRYAKTFSTSEEANKLIEEKNFEQCHVIDKFGQAVK